MGKCRNIVVFITAYLALVIHVGLLSSISALFVDIMDTFSISRAMTVVVQSISIGLYGTCGFLNGALIARIGPRKACIIGTLMSSIGMAVSFLATSVVVLYFSVGVCMGIGISLIYISSCTIIGQYWQEKNVVLVLSIHATGSGVGGIGYPYILPYLSKHYGVRGTLLIFGGILLHGIVFALCWRPINNKLQEVKDELKPNDDIKTITDQVSWETCTTHTIAETGMEIGNGDENTNPERVKHLNTKCVPQTVKGEAEVNKTQTSTTRHTLEKIITILKVNSLIPVIFAQAIGFSSTYIYLYFIADIITDIGYSKDEVPVSLMTFNIAGILGRLIPGIKVYGNPIPVLLVPVVGCVFGLLGFLALIFGKTFAFMIVASSVIGLSFGVFVTSFPVTSLRLVGGSKDNLPIALGVAFTVAGLLTAISGPLNGLISDVTGTYSSVLWEAVGCFAFAILILCYVQWSRYRNIVSYKFRTINKFSIIIKEIS